MTDSIFKLTQAFVAFRGNEHEQNHIVLSDINLEVHRGEWLSVVGCNGSGKSTLLRVLAGLLPLSKGYIERNLSSDKRFGLVMQNPEAQIIGETVREDIQFSMENASIDPSQMLARMSDALVHVGLAGMEDMPVKELSGGQKQLLALAGCIAGGVSVLLLDEAASMLAPASRDQLLLTVKSLQEKGTTVIWVTQQLEELYPADRVLVLAQGQLVDLVDPRTFFYGETGALPQEFPCERAGLTAPYAIQTARKLAALGMPLSGYPLRVEELVHCLPRQLGGSAGGG